jgi:peptidoglycan/xylan/chitin deacetylase (PgdA/CDA1 family)
MRRWFALAAVAVGAGFLVGGCAGAEAESTPPPDCAQIRCVALTFDDGPDEETGRLLDVLAARRVPATFFVIGRQVREHPALVRRMAGEGHEIGNHTYSHRRLTGLPAPDVHGELRRTAEAIGEATGSVPRLVRPPFGTVSEEVAAEVEAPIILWSVDPRDWRIRDSRVISQRVVADVRPGSIVVLHDVYRTTVDAVPAIIDLLKGEGYTFVTVSELFGGQLHPRTIYSERPQPQQPAG